MDPDALYKLTHGIYVLGAAGNGRLCGSIVDAVMQAANKPLVLALSCHNNSYTKSCIEASGEFSLSVLGINVDPFVVANFGFQSSRNVDKWAKVRHYTANGLPYLEDSIAAIGCKVFNTQIFESNTLFTAEVTDCSNRENQTPLTYFDYRTSFKDSVLKFLPQIIKNKGE